MFSIVGRKNNYYCTCVGDSSKNWSIGIRQPAAAGFGYAKLWQMWYKAASIDGILGPYKIYHGRAPSPKISVVRKGLSVEFVCLQASKAGQTEFNQLYPWAVLTAVNTRKRALRFHVSGLIVACHSVKSRRTICVSCRPSVLLTSGNISFQF